MCYNCGCQQQDNDMGSSQNITTKTFEELAKTSGTTPEQQMKNTKELIEKVLAEKDN